MPGPITTASSVRREPLAIGPATSKSVQRFVKQIVHARGAPAAASPQPAEPQSDEGKPDTRKSVTAVIRDQLSPQGLSELRAMMFDPRLALTVAQRDILNRLGRSAHAGDKAGVRSSLLDLAERLDVTSPKDGAVLTLEQSSAAGLNAPVNAGLSRLDKAKRTLEMTQGGRALGVLTPVLQKSGGFTWSDGLDSGWQRLHQRFAQQAHGVVDLVVPGEAPAPSAPTAGLDAATSPAPRTGAAETPVGRWGSPSSGSTAQSPGKWSVPDGSPAATQAGGVGRWGVNDSAGPSGGVGRWAPATTSPDEVKAPAVGQWSSEGSQAAGPPVGEWSSPEKTADGPAPEVGRWTAPSDATDKSPSVGRWSGPAGTAGEPPSAQTPVGAWTTPGEGHPAAPVGRWGGAPEDPAKAPGVGRWLSDQEAESAAAPGRWTPAHAPGAAGSPAPPGSSSASAVSPGPETLDLGKATVAGGVRVADLLAANPKISGLRIVQVVSGSAGQPATLREVTSLGRVLLQKRFGLL